MKILIRRLPKDTHSSQVKALVREAFPTGRFFGLLGASEEPQILECKLYRATEPNSGISEIWCLLRIRPEDAAEQVVKKLNGTAMGTQRLLVRQYLDRGPTDRRQMTLSPEERLGLKGRTERRRHLVIEPIDEPTVEGYAGMTRVYST